MRKEQEREGKREKVKKKGKERENWKSEKKIKVGN